MNTITFRQLLVSFLLPFSGVLFLFGLISATMPKTIWRHLIVLGLVGGSLAGLISVVALILEWNL